MLAEIYSYEVKRVNDTVWLEEKRTNICTLSLQPTNMKGHQSGSTAPMEQQGSQRGLPQHCPVALPLFL